MKFPSAFSSVAAYAFEALPVRRNSAPPDLTPLKRFASSVILRGSDISRK